MSQSNKLLEGPLFLDGRLVGGDKIIWPPSFLTCRRNGGHDCRSTVLCNDHHYDMAGGRNK